MARGPQVKERSKKTHAGPQVWWSVLCLLLLFALLFNGSRQLSLTYDEPSHLAAGYAYLARSMEGLWTIPLRGHPLLINAWEALPLFIGNPGTPLETLNGWESSRQAYARAFIHAVGPIAVSEVAGRLPAILLTVLLAAVNFRWAADLWGTSGGLVALGLLSFDPTLLAHGRLATNDVGVTTMGTLSLFLMWRWSKHHSWRIALGTGIALGCTLLSKSSGILWVGVCFIAAIRTALQKSRPRRRIWAQIMLMGGLAIFVVWAMYGFSIGPIAVLPGIPIPAPLHWESLLFQTNEAAQRPFFALGVLETGRRWWYFPLTFILKNPLPLLIALAIALGSRLRFKQRPLGIWQLFSIVYIIAALIKGPNIGYRHLLPLHPYIYLLITGAFDALWHHTTHMTKLVPNRVESRILSKNFPCRYAQVKSGLSGLGNHTVLLEFM